MRFLKTYGLFFAALIIGTCLFLFRPGGIEGPRPAPVASSDKGFDYSAFDQVLAQAVNPDGTVNYAQLRSDRTALDRFLGQIRAVSPRNQPHRFHTSEARLAYYLNAYNAFVLAGVRDACPIDSVQQFARFDGFFWRLSFLMGEEKVTLNQIAGERIPEVSNSRPEVQFALVRGAKGCAPLPTKAYREETLAADLEAAVRRAVNHPQLARLDGSQLHLSELFRWTNLHDLPHFVGQYRPELTTGNPEVIFDPFDWSLNGSCQ